MEFWTYAPVKQTATQRCDTIKASHPYKLIQDDLGNQILHFTFEYFVPYETKIITIKTNLLLCEKPNPMSKNDSGLFLSPARYVESDDPDICKTAQMLKTSNIFNTAEKIFYWVSDNIRSVGYLSHERGARYALLEKQGDCTEFMDLFVALCRANKIPARGIGGYICKESSILKPFEYHNWAEFYQGGTWRITDPQNKMFIKDYTNYIAMRIISETQGQNPLLQFDRFRLKGTGIKVKMNL